MDTEALTISQAIRQGLKQLCVLFHGLLLFWLLLNLVMTIVLSEEVLAGGLLGPQ